MLTQTTEYALQALAFLATTPKDWREVGHIAESLSIPTNYLSKILGQLTKLGLLESRKGWGGGFRMRSDPGTVSLEEVIRPLEGVNQQHKQNLISKSRQSAGIDGRRKGAKK